MHTGVCGIAVVPDSGDDTVDIGGETQIRL